MEKAPSSPTNIDRTEFSDNLPNRTSKGWQICTCVCMFVHKMLNIYVYGNIKNIYKILKIYILNLNWRGKTKSRFQLNSVPV